MFKGHMAKGWGAWRAGIFWSSSAGQQWQGLMGNGPEQIVMEEEKMAEVKAAEGAVLVVVMEDDGDKAMSPNDFSRP